MGSERRVLGLGSLALPILVRIDPEIGIEIARVVGDFGCGPRRQGEALAGAPNLDLGDDQPGIVAMEFIDFPTMAFELLAVAGLLDQRALAQFVRA